MIKTCLRCGRKYNDNKDSKIFSTLFCCKECEEMHIEEIKYQDWPRDPALKYKVPVGEIACPECGTVQHGILKPYCELCDKPYWI
jgi:hypothetical protein